MSGNEKEDQKQKAGGKNKTTAPKKSARGKKKSEKDKESSDESDEDVAKKAAFIPKIKTGIYTSICSIVRV